MKKILLIIAVAIASFLMGSEQSHLQAQTRTLEKSVNSQKINPKQINVQKASSKNLSKTATKTPPSRASVNSSNQLFNYEFLSGTNESLDNPSARINLYKSNGSLYAQINFLRDIELMKKSSQRQQIEVKGDKIFLLTFQYDSFDNFLTILENGKNIEVLMDDKTKTVIAKTSIKNR